MTRLAGAFIIILAVVAGPLPAAGARGSVTVPDPDVALLTARVWGRDLIDDVEWLVGLGNRHSRNPHVLAVGDSLEARFAALGLATEQTPVALVSGTVYNIIATQTGVVRPDSVVVVCAHYDAWHEDPEVTAPGADDNGSGVAAVLTCARLLAPRLTDCTVKYVLFVGEEQGMFGSMAWTAALHAVDAPLMAALNVDMIGWWTDDYYVPFDLEVITDTRSRWIADTLADVADVYDLMPVVVHENNSAWWGDFWAFWERGYPCIGLEEGETWNDPEFSPYYHTLDDLPATLSLPMIEGSTRVLFATVATLVGLEGWIATVPGPVAGARVVTAPNPCNGRTRFLVEAPGEEGRRPLAIFDPAGRRVAGVDVVLRQGRGEVAWSTTTAGRPLPSGVYFWRLRLAGGHIDGKLTLVE